MYPRPPARAPPRLGTCTPDVRTQRKGSIVGSPRLQLDKDHDGYIDDEELAEALRGVAGARTGRDTACVTCLHLRCEASLPGLSLCCRDPSQALSAGTSKHVCTKEVGHACPLRTTCTWAVHT